MISVNWDGPDMESETLTFCCPRRGEEPALL